jgi:hypothetical protein
MTDFLEMVLAARRKDDGGWIQLLIPIVFVVIYVVSALAKLKRGGAEEDIELEKRPSLRDTEGKFRYKALDEAGARERPAGPRSVPPRAKTLPYAKEGVPGAERQYPAPREPLQVQLRQPQPAPRRPQPTFQPRQAREPSYMRPQTPPVRPGPIYPAQAPAPRPKAKQRPVKPKAAPRTAQKPRQPQKVAADETKPPAQIVHKPRTLRADLSGSSNLQRAIIYSEILGKPLALRDM